MPFIPDEKTSVVSFIPDEMQEKTITPQGDSGERGAVFDFLINKPIEFGAAVSDIAVGAGKGVLSTLQGLSSLGQRFGQTLGLLEKGEVAQIPQEYRTPEGMLQDIGFGAEQVGEFFIPIGLGTKAAAAIHGGRFLKSATAIVGDATEYAMKRAVQTGGNIEDTTGTFLLSLAIPPVIKGVGKVLQTAGKVLPERLYSTIFKTSYEDMTAAYRAMAKGKELNPTLAREVLDRNLKGSAENMAVYSLKKLQDLEAILQPKVVGQVVKLPRGLGQQEYVLLLQRISDKFQGTVFSDRAKLANNLLKSWKSNKGNEIFGDLALKTKRFIDGIRNTSSFKTDPSLSLFQEELKKAADTLRVGLYKSGSQELLNEERVFIQAFDDIVDFAIKKNNRNVIGLADLLAGGGGMVSGGLGQGISAAVMLRGFQQPLTLTNLGIIIDKLAKGTKGIAQPLSAFGVAGSTQAMQ